MAELSVSKAWDETRIIVARDNRLFAALALALVALPAYRRAGFRAYKRAIERFPDPRVLGILPADCAPQIPLLGTLTSTSARPAASTTSMPA